MILDSQQSVSAFGGLIFCSPVYVFAAAPLHPDLIKETDIIIGGSSQPSITIGGSVDGGGLIDFEM